MSAKHNNLSHGVELRPVVMPDDEVFLQRLYFSTRDDLNLLPLEETQKHALIQMQYAAQKQQYSVQHPDADHDLILLDGVPVGRLFVDRGPTAIYLVDISLLPAHRGLSIGTTILEDLVGEAEKARAALGLHVFKTNPAARLYFRMGLTVTADDGLYFEMKKILVHETTENQSTGE